MSNQLVTYGSIDKTGIGSTSLSVNSFCGGKYGYSVQFSLGSLYCMLAENQVRDLIKILQKRVNGVKKYNATSEDLNNDVNPMEVKDGH